MALSKHADPLCQWGGGGTDMKYLTSITVRVTIKDDSYYKLCIYTSTVSFSPKKRSITAIEIDGSYLVDSRLYILVSLYDPTVNPCYTGLWLCSVSIV